MGNHDESVRVRDTRLVGQGAGIAGECGDSGGATAQRGQRGLLAPAGLREHGVQRDHVRHAPQPQLVGELEHVRAVRATEDAVLVLDHDEVGPRRGDGPGRDAVVLLYVLPDDHNPRGVVQTIPVDRTYAQIPQRLHRGQR